MQKIFNDNNMNITDINPDPNFPDAPDPLVPETGIEKNVLEETDADDRVHSIPNKPSDENIQQDADDAIHKNYTHVVWD